MKFTLEELQEPLEKPDWFDAEFGAGANQVLAQMQTMHDDFFSKGDYFVCCEIRVLLQEKPVVLSITSV